MLTRHNRPAGDLTNDEYMLGLIETRFGHPTEQELKDLIYFGPKDVDPKNEITMVSSHIYVVVHHMSDFKNFWGFLDFLDYFLIFW